MPGAPGKPVLHCLALFICVHVGSGWGPWALLLALGREGLGMIAGQPSCVGLGPLGEGSGAQVMWGWGAVLARC